ncbi:MAG: hypothetical protein ACXVFT_18200 [Solirubrobacteraceae bacterium]
MCHAPTVPARGGGRWARGAPTAGLGRSGRLEGDLADGVRLVGTAPADEQRGGDRCGSDLLARLEGTEAAADDLPHRRKYLLLVAGFMRRLFELHLDLVDEVERELDGPAH